MNGIPEIAPIWGAMPRKPGAAEVQQETSALSSTDIFKSAVRQANEAQQEVNRTDYLLTTGQLENPAMSSIAIAEAELSVQMLAQLRTKALEAYNELIRISL